MLHVIARMPGSSGDELSEHGAAIPIAGGRPIQFVDVYPRTADRKVDLFPAHLDAQSPAGLYGYQPDPATSEYPLALISPASERTISSTLSELPRPEVRLLMHPDDASVRGLSDGDEVRIFNALGEVRCGLQVGAWIRPGTVVLPKGLWRKHTANGYTATALAPDSLTDLGGGACFNDARVDVRRANGSGISSAGRPRFWPSRLKVSPRGEPSPAWEPSCSAAPKQESERAAHDHRDCSDRPCGQPRVLRLASTREPSPFRGRRDRPCWRSRAASRDSLKQIRDVLCALRPQYPPSDSVTTRGVFRGRA